jgi:hypothetical protein
VNWIDLIQFMITVEGFCDHSGENILDSLIENFLPNCNCQLFRESLVPWCYIIVTLFLQHLFFFCVSVCWSACSCLM